MAQSVLFWQWQSLLTVESVLLVKKWGWKMAFIEKGVGGEKVHICVLWKYRQHTNAKKKKCFLCRDFENTKIMLLYGVDEPHQICYVEGGDGHLWRWMDGRRRPNLSVLVHDILGKEAAKQVNYNSTWKALLYWKILGLMEMRICRMNGWIQKKKAEPGNSW